MLPSKASTPRWWARPYLPRWACFAYRQRSVFARHGIEINNVVDTLQVSRKLRGKKIDGGHSLKVVCERELGLELDKAEQTSDWTRRPLTKRQLAYAAVDAELLLTLAEHLKNEDPQRGL